MSHFARGRCNSRLGAERRGPGFDFFMRYEVATIGGGNPLFNGIYILDSLGGECGSLPEDESLWEKQPCPMIQKNLMQCSTRCRLDRQHQSATKSGHSIPGNLLQEVRALGKRSFALYARVKQQWLRTIRLLSMFRHWLIRR